MDSKKLAMLTDFYELTMMNGFVKNSISEDIAVFDVFFREQNESTYCIACGLEQVVDYIENLVFTNSDIEYLKSLECFDNKFLLALRKFKFSGSIRAVPEGTVVFPNEPLLIVKGKIFEAQLLESALLNIINFQTLIATKASRIVNAANGKKVIEFGLRRAQGPDAALLGARAAIIAGCDGTSNVLASKMYGTKPRGTHAHSWVTAFKSELDAFRAYAKMYPDECLLLIDTYDTLKSGLKNALIVFKELRELGHEPLGVRLDSGDIAYLSKETRKALDVNGFKDAKIFASGDLDEYTMTSLRSQGAKIDMYGVGTRLITSHSNPSLGGVYKIAAFGKEDNLRPKIKISDNPQKITNPGEKNLYRIYDKESGKAIADLIALKTEVIHEDKPLTLTHQVERWKSVTIENFYIKNLLQDVYVEGKLVYKKTKISDIQKNCVASQDEFWEEIKRLDKPQIFKVDLSDELYNLKQRLLLSGGVDYEQFK